MTFSIFSIWTELDFPFRLSSSWPVVIDAMVGMVAPTGVFDRLISTDISSA